MLRTKRPKLEEQLKNDDYEGAAATLLGDDRDVSI